MLQGMAFFGNLLFLDVYILSKCDILDIVIKRFICISRRFSNP